MEDSESKQLAMADDEFCQIAFPSALSEFIDDQAANPDDVAGNRVLIRAARTCQRDGLMRLFEAA